MSELLGRLADAIENLDSKNVKGLVQEALAAGLRPSQVLNDGLSEGMRRVGVKFNSGDMYMPEVLVACDVYFEGLSVVRPLLAADASRQLTGTAITIDDGQSL